MKIGKTLVWISLTITLVLFLMAKFANSEDLALTWVVASQFFSLIGLTLLAVSFVLSGRFIFVEKIFGGLDKVYKIHHITGGIAFVLILHHPLFLLVNALPNLTLAWKYIIFSNILPFNFGVIGLYAMMLMLILTLLVNLPYSLWKKTHELMGIALLFSALHILTITSDVSRYMPLRVWVIMVIIVSFWAVIYRRFLYSFIGPVYSYTVEKVNKFNDVIDIWLKPTKNGLPYQPGQFVFAEIEKLGNEAHPYSIASFQTDGRIRLAIKILGDYTLGLRAVEPGDTARLWGPYGTFNQATISSKDMVWIAGGIGITPFLGLIEKEMADGTDRKVDLFYCFSSEDDKPFADEIIKKIAGQKNIHYLEYCSAVRGRITAEGILQMVGDFGNKKFMLCGPVGMMLSLTEQLKKMGVKNKDIIFEDFNFK